MANPWWRSSIGKKLLMAASGLALFGFVVAHLLGNLLIFRGPDALNAYAHKLRALGPWLWVARTGLLAAVAVHIWTSVQINRENRAARPVAYRIRRNTEATFSGRTMLLSGLLFLAFLLYHLLHFTFRVTHPAISHGLDAFGRHDVYRMVVMSFSQPFLVLAYVLGVAAVCLHLHHGIGSTLQTLGVTDNRTLRWADGIGRLIALAVFMGYSLIPLAVLTGFVTLTTRATP